MRIATVLFFALLLGAAMAPARGVYRSKRVPRVERPRVERQWRLQQRAPRVYRWQRPSPRVQTFRQRRRHI